MNFKQTNYINFAFVRIFQVSDEFVREVQSNNITVAMQEIFLSDPYTRVEKLKVRGEENK